MYSAIKANRYKSFSGGNNASFDFRESSTILYSQYPISIFNFNIQYSKVKTRYVCYSIKRQCIIRPLRSLRYTLKRLKNNLFYFSRAIEQLRSLDIGDRTVIESFFFSRAATEKSRLISRKNRSWSDRLTGHDAVLDRPGLPDAVEDLHEPGELQPLYSAHPDNRRLLHGHRGHDMVAGRSATSGTYEGHTEGVLEGSHTKGEDQNS